MEAQPFLRNYLETVMENPELVAGVSFDIGPESSEMRRTRKLRNMLERGSENEKRNAEELLKGIQLPLM